jgi:hypothetical protein
MGISTIQASYKTCPFMSRYVLDVNGNELGDINCQHYHCMAWVSEGRRYDSHGHCALIPRTEHNQTEKEQNNAK